MTPDLPEDPLDYIYRQGFEAGRREAGKMADIDSKSIEERAHAVIEWHITGGLLDTAYHDITLEIMTGFACQIARETELATIERCASVVDEEDVPSSWDAPAEMFDAHPVDAAIAAVKATKKSIAAEIRALARQPQGGEDAS